MPVPDRTSIEVLLDIIRGIQEEVKLKDSPSPDKSLFLSAISSWDVERVIMDHTLLRALETAGLGDLADFLYLLNDLNHMIGVPPPGVCVGLYLYPSPLSDQDYMYAIAYMDALDTELHDVLTKDFVESITTRLNRLPVGFPAEAILPKRSELTEKPKIERIRKEREIRQVNAKSLDIGAGANRISSDVGIYRRENGMLYVRVVIDGKLIRRSLGTRKESEALLKTRSVIMAALEGQKEKKVPKLAEFAKAYLEYSKRQHRTSTREKRTSRIRKLIENLGSMRLDQIDKRAIRLYYQKRLQEVSPASVNRERSLLSSIMEYACELDLIQENPVRKVKKLRESPGRERYLTPDEIKRLLDACETLSKRKDVGHNPILYEIVLTAILTGLRKGNLQNLKWSQVDYKTGNIVIPAGEYKNRKPLYFPINPCLQKILSGLRYNYPYGTYVFSKSDGTSYGDWKRSFNTACEIAGLKDVHFHDLRHTHATLLNMLGANEYVIRALMGHQTLAASKRYVHTPPEIVRKASNALGDYVMRRILDDSN